MGSESSRAERTRPNSKKYQASKQSSITKINLNENGTKSKKTHNEDDIEKRTVLKQSKSKQQNMTENAKKVHQKSEQKTSSFKGDGNKRIGAATDSTTEISLSDQMIHTNSKDLVADNGCLIAKTQYSTPTSSIYPSIKHFQLNHNNNQTSTQISKRLAPTISCRRRRLALIFGSDEYLNRLNSCVKDARDMAKILTKMNFECTLVENANKRQMERSEKLFQAKIRSNDIVLLYFSGHGMEEKGRNYLVPVDSFDNNDHSFSHYSAEYDFICLDDVLKRLNQHRNLVNIVILDACRADEQNDTWKSKDISGFLSSLPIMPVYGTSKGLSANVRTPQNSEYVLIFSSDPGTISIASNVSGENSLFTSALLQHISTPNISIEEMMKKVSKEVLKLSQNKQRPWMNTCLLDSFCFNQQ
ncbi:unnamed protein product [Didymodactylos carnosus]|uniref:Caspase family p20 domain-containing protein n=1 Tax=Didymodactylos carnosus TaxID=1234261 RepID=A0A813WU82_9BILA|nr:unnamed protein product [Didymodactylos carnosus]CAF1203778.1 unnamed protein product [Didymodactylos carnosus]CAF3649849.1 unnamed protein product [Didymodactylos carnosus]CAF4013430.1 unnamed protein product [Didymodactylos carnosus]